MTKTARKATAPRAARKTSAKAKATTPAAKAPAPATETEIVRRRGSVVGMTFKQRYADKGRPNDCGDWLAVQLDTLLTKPLSDAVLVALAEANGLGDKYARWNAPTATRDHALNIGQRRMLLGLALRPVVATSGKLNVPGEKKARTPDAAFVAKHAH